MKYPILMVNIYSDSSISYSHGLASLAGVLRANGYKSSDMGFHPVLTSNMELAAKEILEYSPSIVLFTCTSNQWEKAKSLADEIKTIDAGIDLCIGGPHVTADATSVKRSKFDYYVSGEGESIILPIVNNKILGRCKNINRNTIARKAMPVVVNLDDLPMPDLTIFDKKYILEYPSLMFSRGCIFECSYCMSRNGGPEGKVRWKSPERALAEVLDMIKYAKPEELFFDDDTLLKNHKWVIDFCALYRKHVDLPFYCNARPETITAKIVNTLRESGCLAVGIGLESGSYRIRKNILQRNITDETIIRAFDVVHKNGLKTWSFNMIGLPTESYEDLNDTIKLNNKIQSDYVRISMFTAYPGTPIFNTYPKKTYDRSYFEKPAHLCEQSLKLIKNWIATLTIENRLWYTKSEHDILQSNR